MFFSMTTQHSSIKIKKNSHISNSFPSATIICFSRFQVYATTNPCNAHAVRCEIFKMADKPKREIKKKRFCYEYSTYTLVRKANLRTKDTKLYGIEIDMILNRYRGPVSNLLRSAFNCLPPRLLAFLTAF